MTNTFFYTELSDISNIDLCEGHLRNKSQVSDNILNSVVEINLCTQRLKIYLNGTSHFY